MSCTVAFDPFKTQVGGVPKDLKTELKQGVADQRVVDEGRDPSIDPITAAREVDLMNAVWGANFDPHATANRRLSALVSLQRVTH